MPSQRYWELLYRGAGLPGTDTATIGQNLGQSRGPLLATLIQQGKLKPQDLSPEDTKAAGSNMTNIIASGVGGGILGGVLGGTSKFFGNLGSDIVEATKGLGPGIANTGAAIVHDVTHPSDWGRGTLVPSAKGNEGQVAKKVVNPIVDQYAYTYGGVGAPEDSSIWSRVYEHPLGPIMDALTVASLGSGGAARAGSLLSNAGKISSESRLARLGSTQGRSPLITERNPVEGVEYPTISRLYSPRPLRKGLQIMTDALGEFPTGRYQNPVNRLQQWQARNYGLKMGSARKDSAALQNVNQQVHQLIPLMRDLSPAEFNAFDRIARGVNSPQWLHEYRTAVGRSIENDLPEGANAEDFGRAVDSRLAPSRANPDPETESLASDPNQSPALMAALHHYYNLVDERMRPELTEEQFTAKSNELRDALVALRGDSTEAESPPQPNNAGPTFESFSDLHRTDQNKFNRAEEEGIYVDDLKHDEGAPQQTTPPTPPAEAAPLSPHPFPNPTIAPSQLARNFQWHEPTRLGELFGREAGFLKHQGQFSPSNVTYQNVLQEPFNSFRPNPNPLLAGVHRPDPRSYVDLIAKHERDVIDQAYSAELLDRWSLKGEDGEPVTVASDTEAQTKYGPQYTAVHPTAPLHYYNDQTTVADMVSYMEQNGFPVDGPEMQAAVRAIGEDTVMKMTQAARRQQALVIPRSVAEYQRKIENASKPYENSALRMLVKPLNVWRQYTLSLMPRWALNTAVGSFMLNAVKGVGPKSYLTAQGLRHGGEFGENLFQHPNMGGVELGNTVGMEMQELASQAGMGTNRVAQRMMRGVQEIEDFFRRASAVHSISQQAKQAIRESGTILEDFESAKGPRSVDEFRDLIEQDPALVRRAVEDVDRFSYNFASLGPFERRALRQIAPFWGWYRFISGVAYRLPIDYPGRTNLLTKIGQMGMESNEENFGTMPQWLKGNVLFDNTAGKGINYLSTAGTNPFSQIFNPAQMLNPTSPEGVAGVAQLGQGSPIIQAAMAMYGIDPMSGGQLDVSPESGVSPDLQGTLRDESTGEEKNLQSVEPLQRGIAALIRAFPEARIGERFRGGGRAPYPESIPLLHERYRATKPENQYGGTLQDMLAQMFGVAVRPFNLESYQSQRARGKRAAMRKGARGRAAIKRAEKK